MQHILFKRVTTSKRTSLGFEFLFAAPKEPWQEDDKDSGNKPIETLEFVSHVKSGRELADLVRKSPLDKYVLFRGNMTEVKVAIPVYIGNEAADGVAAEWGE